MKSVVVMMTPYPSVSIEPNAQPACLYASGKASTPVPMAALDTFMTANTSLVILLLRECVDVTPRMQQTFSGLSPEALRGLAPSRCPAESSRCPKRGMLMISASPTASRSGVSGCSPGKASGIPRPLMRATLAPRRAVH